LMSFLGILFMIGMALFFIFLFFNKINLEDGNVHK
jgi:hypothetical protein